MTCAGSFRTAPQGAAAELIGIITIGRVAIGIIIVTVVVVMMVVVMMVVWSPVSVVMMMVVVVVMFVILDRLHGTRLGSRRRIDHAQKRGGVGDWVEQFRVRLNAQNVAHARRRSRHCLNGLHRREHRERTDQAYDFLVHFLLLAGPSSTNALEVKFSFAA
jgi:hypothetical protein